MKLTELEKEREDVLRKVEGLGDMRSGSISIRYQRCGKRPCICHEPEHPGHGPIYSFSTIEDGKTKIRNFKLGPELDKLQKEVENYQTFRKLSQDFIEINNVICDLRPVPETEDVNELEELKKKLRRRLMRKHKKKLTG